jgi:hypothetical protein
MGENSNEKVNYNLPLGQCPARCSTPPAQRKENIMNAKRNGQQASWQMGILLFLTLAALAMPTTARGDIYVTSAGGEDNGYNGTVGEYDMSGATVNANLVSGLYMPQGIAMSGSDLFVTSCGYYANSGTVGEYTLGAPGKVTASNPSLISGLHSPTAIAVSGQYLFVADAGGPDNGYNGTIGEYNLNGTPVNADLVSGLNDPTGIAVSGSDLFVTNYNTGGTSGTIDEYTLVAPGETFWANPTLISGLNEPTGIAVSGSDLFVAIYNTGTIAEYKLDGTPVNTSLVSGLLPTGIALSGQDLFVTNEDGSISECTTSGIMLNNYLVSGVEAPCGIAVGVPEPATLLLLGLGGLMLRRKH